MRQAPWYTHLLTIVLLAWVGWRQYEAIHIDMRKEPLDLLLVPVVGQPLQAGVRLTANDLMFRPRRVPQPALIVRDPARIEGRYLARAIEAGDTIRETDLRSHPGTHSDGAADAVIVTVQLPAERWSGTDLQRGDKVDVWTTTAAAGKTKGSTAMLIGGVIVVDTKPTDGDKKGTHVSLLVPRDTAAAVVSGLADGGVVSITRGIGAPIAKGKPAPPPAKAAGPGKRTAASRK